MLIEGKPISLGLVSVQQGEIRAYVPDTVLLEDCPHGKIFDGGHASVDLSLMASSAVRTKD